MVRPQGWQTVLVSRLRRHLEQQDPRRDRHEILFIIDVRVRENRRRGFVRNHLHGRVPRLRRRVRARKRRVALLRRRVHRARVPRRVLSSPAPCNSSRSRSSSIDPSRRRVVVADPSRAFAFASRASPRGGRSPPHRDAPIDRRHAARNARARPGLVRRQRFEHARVDGARDDATRRDATRRDANATVRETNGRLNANSNSIVGSGRRKRRKRPTRATRDARHEARRSTARARGDGTATTAGERGTTRGTNAKSPARANAADETRGKVMDERLTMTRESCAV